ncbi:RNA polymerase factor sigma-54 [Ligilactobacillus pobuzihii]|uniref:RNA polymerase factor sigma-54 n=1 Tax=Ligilactobacillus pobuzihii TaxID=449659 RepID=A0A0R2L6G8_9LACO|nr:RNA polymerase factor sigma-54 [Ligilactobacillus pobuzihii]KRK10547.1 RNA polymerase factor sigma-54 [Ligilactobacillus pobuzihii E100301 = KCTC 13174]KRN97416.1 RNA polymerase factor sigma-54 [Ligilactobacillus pobuzihii]GEN48081.1 RNA polymerase sigma-54 factor [Ligilactobacillus pobuzihii]
MSLRQNLGQQQTQVQKLAMTQRMQQSIRMLKFNTDELQNYLKQQELENPFIIVNPRQDKNESANVVSASQVANSNTDWTEFTSSRQGQSLFDYLLDQVHLTMRKTALRGWVIFLVDHLDSNGYLDLDLDQLLESDLIDKTTLIDALTLLQNLDPPGVGARNLQECLILQARDDKDAPLYTTDVLQDDFENFIERKWKPISHEYEISLGQVQKILDYVQTLSPAPGSEYSQEEVGYIQPDLILQNDQEKELDVKTTKQTMPKVVFRDKYFQEMLNNKDPQVKEYAEDKKKEFAAIYRDIEQRGSTLLRVGREIVKRQKKFLLDSSKPLVPLLLRDVANVLKLHESTISRTVNGKYLQTPHGVYELKFFFSQAVNYSTEGTILTANDVKARIKAEIMAENKLKPLSDQKISKLLASEGLELSRRTVAKYRDQLNIPSSSQRKKYS